MPQVVAPRNYTGPVLVLLPSFPLISPLQYEVGQTNHTMHLFM